MRARTQRAILDAAVRLFARQGIGETAIHEIAAEADLSNGSFYNYFRTREELVEAAGTRLAAELTDEISRMSVNVTDPAERVSIGSRRFMLKAFEDPTWGAAVLRVWANTPLMARRVSDAALSDLRSGRRRGRFRYDDERAAVDLLHGSVLAAMRTLLEGGARADHAVNVARLVLRGLGVPDEEAAAIARRPLPVEAPGPRVGEPRRK
ncbi:MAG: TetR/AcrR family transcriptional regulator [Deltaproteobacteria bacterium]|nr:TetR/AcrR family transcriptional regulator [Deltaproteobacteria bacterium]